MTIDLSNISVAFAVASVFTVVIIFIFFLSWILHIFGKGQKFVSVSPNLLTGLGVLGTFVGIFIGLQNFNVNNITESVPPLLDGMKTAFFTSILGMFSGIFIRGVIAIFPQTKAETGAKTSEDVFKMIEDISIAVSKNDENFDKIIKVISGDGDSSVSTQLTKMRSDNHDNHKELVKELRDFAEQITENSVKTIIESLERIVHDFNKNIGEQFGENFARLNDAVGKLLEWQENYKQELAIMQEQFQRCVDSIDKVKEAMQSIRENTDAIPPAMERLPEIVRMATDTLEAFAKMKEQAIDAFPRIEENLDRLASGLASQTESFETALEAQKESYKQLETAFSGIGEKAENAMERLATQTENAMERLTEQTQNATQQLTERTQEAVENMNNGMQTATQQLTEKTQAAVDNMNDGMQTATQQLTERTQDAVDNMNVGMQTAIREAMGEIQQGVKASIDQTNAELKENFTQFDEQMRQEITSALEEMGSSLASLSRRFVDDYTPLTEKLQELLKALDMRNEEQIDE